MTQQDVFDTIAQDAELTHSQAEELVRVTFEIIARELSAGEPVNVDGLGKFYTVETPAQEVEDPPGSGRKVITLPVIEPAFDPDPDLEKKVKKAVEANPELFEGDDEEEDEEEALPEKESAKAEKDASPNVDPAKDEPIVPKEKPLGRASDITFMEIGSRKIDREILALVPQHLAKQYGAVPIDLEEGTLTVAMIDPEDYDAVQEIRKVTGLAVKAVLTTRDDLTTVLDQYTGLQAEVQAVIDTSDLDFSSKELKEASEEDVQETNSEHSPTVKIVYSLLKRAVKERASDIHIEPYERKVVVRFRLDGILQQRLELPKEIQAAIVSRLKILANLKIDEQRLPQDGRFSLLIDRRQVDFRLSTIPVVYGEKVVMRILDKSVGILSLEDVGLADRGLEVLKKNMERSHGMILVTGPTGSGKTTTLYAVLGKLMSETVNIITLEDPVEYRIESINQSQVHAEIGYSFATGLRSVVRQDPDIVMLGEIRDEETADMAVHAALTGHVVLSTLHTNDAAGAFPRLIDMHVEPFLITSSVHTVIAQRLAREICENCREKRAFTKEEEEEVTKEIKRMPIEVQHEVAKMPLTGFRGKGCDRCNGHGYRGRMGIFEVLDVTEAIRALVMQRASGADVADQAIKEGMVTMVQDGITKVLRGNTTIEEVWRVTKA